MIVSGRKLSSMLIFAVNEQMAEWQRVSLADWKNEIRSVVFLTGSSFSKLIRKFCKPAWALDFNWRKSVSLFSGIILSFLSPLVLELLLVSICIRVRWALPLCLTLPESWPCVRPSVSCAEPGTGVGFAACHPGLLLGLLCLPAPGHGGVKGEKTTLSCLASVLYSFHIAQKQWRAIVKLQHPKNLKYQIDMYKGYFFFKKN